MAEAVRTRWTPPDQAARDRIRTELGTSLLVEAGAGSGKTTAMVGRMVELIRTGAARAEEIAAVTFTRKAAAELRERFQIALEGAYRDASLAGDSAAADRLRAALDEMDRCFLGTIHSFCGRLLRERPLEAGVAPGFREVSGADEDRLRAESWSRFLERCSARRSPLLARLAAVGLRPAMLKQLYVRVSDNADVRFDATPEPRPTPAEIEPVRRGLERLLAEAHAALPEEPPEGWDALQSKTRRLEFGRRFGGWDTDVGFFDALADAVHGGNDAKVTRWGEARPFPNIKARVARWDAIREEGAPERALLDRWLAHRYPVALRFARAAAAFYARERRRSGQLIFADLLGLTARLLRDHTEVRAELGGRFRQLLVDEFQDTDPVQAEILFLLASDDPAIADWQAARPRPGSLFVVGDPKQSIYRFRRADIAVYNGVKERIRSAGDVLGLEANFRSGAAVEAFVNGAFRSGMPTEENEHQARFVELRTAPDQPPGSVRWYRFDAAPGKGPLSAARVAMPCSERIAAWIAGRIVGEVPGPKRRAKDFLVLAWGKAELHQYARALEARGVAVQVTGAGVGAEEELREFAMLLRALADPGDPVLTVAVLEGLFFGLSHEDLYDHAAAGGRFALLAPGGHPDSPAALALAKLRSFWQSVHRAPADVAVPGIAEELGLLPYAAGGELGLARGGALLYALDAVRRAALDGRTSLAEAVAAIDAALAEEADAQLAPGDADAVRVMNLHKAKGLEAPVVVLAAPTSKSDHAVREHFRRSGARATGYLVVTDSSSRHGAVVARPLRWPEYEAAERPYLAAEQTRLLYVAATRAAEELLIARCKETEDDSVWSGFHAWLDDAALADELVLNARPRPARPVLAQTAETLHGRVQAVAEQRTALAQPSFHLSPVTRRVKGEGELPGVSGSGGRGPEWGTAVHRAMEAAARGLLGLELRSACRGFLLEGERPTDDHGEPAELDELVALVETLRRSPLWRRAREAERLLVEVPFALSLGRAEAEAMGMHVDPSDPRLGAPTQMVEGVLDLAFLEPGGWVVADYKTDVFASAEDARQRGALYRRQVDLYAACWARITGQQVRERVILYTSLEREDIW